MTGRAFMVALILSVLLTAGILAVNVSNHTRCEAKGGQVGPRNLCLTPDGRVLR